MTHIVKSLDPSDVAQVARCFRVFTHLRPHLTEAQFLERVPAQADQGYAVVYIEADGNVAAAAGFRTLRFLAWGKVLYIDDLITDPALKKRGFGGALLDWLIVEARRQECDAVHLDTGYQRHDAHRLYLNKGFRLECHHMAKPLT